MAGVDSHGQFNALIDEWKQLQGTLREDDIASVLNRISEVFEKETEAYYKSDPDPMDDRHPSRASPQCNLGQLMRSLFKSEDLMTKLVNEYTMSGRTADGSALHTATCRLLLVLQPGLETSAVFQETDGLVLRLLSWAREAEEPLRSYATGLLGGAMDIQDVAHSHKDANMQLVPVMLKRLQDLREMQEEEMTKRKSIVAESSVRHFADIGLNNSAVAGMPTSPASTSTPTTTSTYTDTPIATRAAGGDSCTAAASSTDSDGIKALCKTPTKSDTASSAAAVTATVPGSPAQSSIPSQAASALSSQAMSPRTPSQALRCSHAADAESCQVPGKSRSMSPGRYMEDYPYRTSLKRSLSPGHSVDYSAPKRSRIRNDSYGGVFDPDASNSSWAEMEPFVIGSYSLKHPLSVTMKARLIIQYLITMGDYQELLTSAFEGNAMDQIFFYIDLSKNTDVRLAFEALRYLSTLICHKKFTIEFLQREGVQRLLRVNRPSIAATGVALCLYYLSYFEDAMERVCLLPDHVLSDLIGYMMWLLECSHDSSRCHACMFFTQVFSFRVLLEMFDKRDGLRRIFNMISTLEILNCDPSDSTLSDDQVFSMRQAARHVCGSLKRYFEAHLVIKAEEVRRSHIRSDGTSPLQETPAYKPMKLSSQVVSDSLELLMEFLPVRTQWTPEATFHKLGGVTLLLQLIAMSPSWNSYPGKPETIRNALDVLHVLMVTPKSQLMLLGNVKVDSANTVTPAMSVITGLAEGEVLSDAEVQKGALNILVSCLCGPSERLGGGVGRYMGSGSKRKVNVRVGEDVLSRLWNSVQNNNGIMVLLKLLSVKAPITEADTIRCLACRALVGLSRSETVKQILSKLPIFNNGQLQNLMKEPVLQDKRQEHVKFCKYASQLLERVSGKQANTLDASLEDIRKADIVAQTKIMYREKELMQLIHDHLVQKGFTETASKLQKEAGLPRPSTPPPPHPASPHIFSSPSTPKLTRQLSQPTPGHSMSTPVVSSSATSHHPSTSSSSSSSGVAPHDHPTPSSAVMPSPGPLRFTLHRNSVGSSPSQHKPSFSRSRFMRESGHGSSHRTRTSTSSVKGVEYNMSLDNIVTEYLRKQHALCRNPVSTCPPMSLFEPHRCPEPLGRRIAPVSITSRLLNRAILPPYGGTDGAKLNRKLFFNRFQVCQTYRDKDDDNFASCCFSHDEKTLMLGTYSGDIKFIELYEWTERQTLQCHSAPIIKMEPGHGGRLLLTSAWGVTQECALWNSESDLVVKHRFDDQVAEFSKMTQDRIIGTNNETAHIYDVATGVRLMTLYDASKANNYRANIATFSPTDELVLNDGVLWDVRSRKPLHKFDKFNQYISGVFHPHGLEIVINSEVWDQRSYKLIHTVPALDQCQIKFNYTGDVIFAIRVDDDLDNSEDNLRAHYSSTLRTFDATDYSSIGTLDLKTRNIFDLCTDRQDGFMAVIEQNTQVTETGSEESICRLYQLQKLRDEEDHEQEEEEEGEAAEEEDEDDDDDDDDPSFLDQGSSQSEDEDEDNGGANNPDDGNHENGEEDEDDEEPMVMEFTPSNSEEEDNDDNDYDDDDILFALV
ncbi:DDB1- and CUL4-associated factor 1-like isoform X2 [Babylonia areolata]|uniref:DDB1- and CUL4-associated factor 1-like isoform X2 n=1 Tax=Babylonia areolata TaxID=304850 RepID=UPI003FD1BD3E